MIYWPSKAPGAKLDHAFNFADVLDSGETISTRVVSAAGVTVDSSAIVGEQVQAWLSGGTLGMPGVVSCIITTSLGRTYSETGIVPIGEEPISLNMAKAQLRLGGDSSKDAMIEGLVMAAREHVEKYCGVKLASVAGELQFATWYELNWMRWAPIQSVVSVSYLDTAGVEQLLDPSVYEPVLTLDDGLSPMIRTKINQSWPSLRPATDAIRVSAVAGYRVVPQPIIQAMLLLITQWFDNPSAIGPAGSIELPNAVTALLCNYRRF